MSEQENIKITRQYVDNLNKHTNDANRSLLSDDTRTEVPGEQRSLNRDQTLQYNQRFIDAFPDLRFDVKDIIAQGDQVAIHWVASGTHTAPLTLPTGGSLPPTRKSVTVPGVTISEVRNNKITHQFLTWDQVTFLMQLGVLTEQEMMSMTRK